MALLHNPFPGNADVIATTAGLKSTYCAAFEHSVSQQPVLEFGA
jgi:hypothetical protein